MVLLKCVFGAELARLWRRVWRQWCISLSSIEWCARRSTTSCFRPPSTASAPALASTGLHHAVLLRHRASTDTSQSIPAVSQRRVDTGLHRTGFRLGFRQGFRLGFRGFRQGFRLGFRQGFRQGSRRPGARRSRPGLPPPGGAARPRVARRGPRPVPSDANGVSGKGWSSDGDQRG